MKETHDTNKNFGLDNDVFPTRYQMDAAHEDRHNKYDHNHNSKMNRKAELDKHHPISARKPRQLSGRHH